MYGLPTPSAEAPPRTGSPLEDLADMSFALGQVSREAMHARPHGEEWRARGLSEAWKRRNRSAFLRGYLDTPGVEDLVPRDARVREKLLAGFELIRYHHFRAMSSAST
jgi:predicted trehalose synthase